MALDKPMRAFGVFSTTEDAEAALTELKAGDFRMEQVSVIARDPAAPSLSEPTRSESKAQTGTNIGAIAGGTVGGTLGLLLGLGTLAAVPGLGTLALIGAAATALGTTLTTGVVGATAGGLLGALVGYGIPEVEANRYSDRINRGQYLVMVEGTEADIRQVEAVFSRWNVQELRTYVIPAAS